MLQIRACLVTPALPAHAAQGRKSVPRPDAAAAAGAHHSHMYGRPPGPGEYVILLLSALHVALRMLGLVGRRPRTLCSAYTCGCDDGWTRSLSDDFLEHFPRTVPSACTRNGKPRIPGPVAGPPGAGGPGKPAYSVMRSSDGTVQDLPFPDPSQIWRPGVPRDCRTVCCL